MLCIARTMLSQDVSLSVRLSHAGIQQIVNGKMRPLIFYLALEMLANLNENFRQYS